MMDELDSRLETLLAPCDRAVDRDFVARIAREVEIEVKVRSARALAWKTFLKELASSGVIIAVLAMAANLVGRETTWQTMPQFGPATLALCIFAVWTVAILRPASYSLR